MGSPLTASAMVSLPAIIMIKVTDEIKNLFQLARTLCGGDVTSTEITDKQLCDILQVAVSDYAQKVQMELIGNQYMGLFGKSYVDPMSMAYAFATRSLDLSKQYSYWFSKEVGLQQEGPWELKKDFIKIEPGKQVYVVPSGRTLNKVMYVAPPTTDLALFANYMGGSVGFMPGLGQVGAGYGYGAGMGGFYTVQASDVAYLASDLKYKRSLFRSDLTYKVTAGPDGTKLIHLMSTPGSKFSFGFSGSKAGNMLGLVGCEVWYTYYDTSGGNEDECMRYHKDDVILSPYQVPLAQIDYAYLNEPAKASVRQIFVAKVKQTLGNIRGKYSGKISIPQAELNLDYQMLIQQGKEEYDAAMEYIKVQLERLRPVNMLKEQSELMQSNMELLKQTPLGIYRI